jgi:hypothetical protein
MANPHWTRWIHSSVAKYLKTVATTNSLAVLIEGVDDRDDPFQEAPDRIEIRVNGPFSQEISHNYHRILVDVNVLLISQMGDQTRNVWDHDRYLGVFHEAMDGRIPIYRFGTGPEDDDDSLLGCLVPRSGKNDSIRVLQFGQIDTTDRLRQGMVDARYEMYLNE